jgi:hypothetical protein
MKVKKSFIVWQISNYHNQITISLKSQLIARNQILLTAKHTKKGMYIHSVCRCAPLLYAIFFFSEQLSVPTQANTTFTILSLPLISCTSFT